MSSGCVIPPTIVATSPAAILSFMRLGRISNSVNAFLVLLVISWQRSDAKSLLGMGVNGVYETCRASA